MTGGPTKGRDVVVVFDLDTEGHHAGYILHLIARFRDSGLKGRLVVASVANMVSDHRDLAEAIANTPSVP